jgi:hypothetical protein
MTLAVNRLVKLTSMLFVRFTGNGEANSSSSEITANLAAAIALICNDSAGT